MLSVLKPRAAPDTSRDRLKQALVARNAAKEAIIAKRETLERLESVVRLSDDLAREAANATRAANESRQRWVRDGCLANAREHQALTDVAAEAARAAQSAALDATAVSKELARAQDAIQSAELDLRGCEEGITAAVAITAVQENAQLLAELVQDAERFLSTREKVMGLRLALYRPWALSTKNSMDPSHEALELIDRALDRAAIKSWERHVDDRRDPKEFLDAIAAPWRALAAKLRGDCNS